jgi:homoserine O-acetyltransferase
MTELKSIASPAIQIDDRLHEADHPSSDVVKFGMDQPLKLDCGVDLAPFQIAYQTYGELKAARSNAIVV